LTLQFKRQDSLIRSVDYPVCCCSDIETMPVMFVEVSANVIGVFCFLFVLAARFASAWIRRLAGS
jgi:hypothetical protein